MPKPIAGAPVLDADGLEQHDDDGYLLCYPLGCEHWIDNGIHREIHTLADERARVCQCRMNRWSGRHMLPNPNYKGTT